MTALFRATIRPDSLTVTSGFAVFRCEVDAATDAAPRVGHDPQAALQDGGHHRYVRAVPQKTAVLQAVVLTEAFSLRRAANVSRGGVGSVGAVKLLLPPSLCPPPRR